MRNCSPRSTTSTNSARRIRINTNSNSHREQFNNYQERRSTEYEDYVDVNGLENIYAQLNINATKESNLINKNETSTLTSEQEVMGQNLSLRRPKLSLTWVLRDQQRHHQQQQQQQNQNIPSTLATNLRNSFKEKKKKNRDNIVENFFHEKYIADESSTKLSSPINITAAPPEKSRVNGILPTSSIHEKPIKEGRKSLRTKKKLSREKVENISSNQSDLGLKSTYSEPSLYAAVSDGGPRRHRQRKRRERARSQRFGYQIKNVDEYLSKVR